MPREPWPADPLPAQIVVAVRDHVRSLVDGIMTTVAAENPVYAEVLEEPEGLGLRLGAEQAVSSFLDAVARGERPALETAEVWRRLGEAEFQSGRSLDALRAAFRTGIRAAWRGAADIAAAAGVPVDSVIALAEAIFLYTDELASDAVEGYLRMQSDEAGERARRRRRLAALLADESHRDPEAVEHAAQLARWPLPARLAAVAVTGGGEQTRALARRLDDDVLTGPDFLLVPDPDGPGRLEALRRAIAGLPSAVGPAVSPADAARSLAWARMAVELIERGALAGERPVLVSDHLAAIILLRDPALARELVARRLGPLEELPEAERERLLTTLAAWLEHQRHTPRIAAELHVHPQTVRYRIATLRELLGEVLEHPEARFDLELALRARKALHQVR